MKRMCIKKQAISPTVAICVCLALVCSFGVHSLQVEHSHPGHAHISGATHSSETETTLSVNEYIHGNEQKIFLAVVLSILLLGIVFRPIFLHTTWSQLLAVYATRIRFQVKQIYANCNTPSYLQSMFSCGVLHPKLF